VGILSAKQSAGQTKAVELDVRELRWSWRSRRHGAVHGLRQAIGDAVLANAPRFFENPREDSAARYLMVGPDATGRSWTIVLRPTRTEGVWIPVTGWPSRPSEIREYAGAQAAGIAEPDSNEEPLNEEKDD
jgi:hypothetical protein